MTKIWTILFALLIRHSESIFRIKKKNSTKKRNSHFPFSLHSGPFVYCTFIHFFNVALLVIHFSRFIFSSFRFLIVHLPTVHFISLLISIYVFFQIKNVFFSLVFPSFASLLILYNENRSQFIMWENGKVTVNAQCAIAEISRSQIWIPNAK